MWRVFGLQQFQALKACQAEGVDRDGLGGDVGVGEDFLAVSTTDAACHAEAIAGQPDASCALGWSNASRTWVKDFSLPEHHRFQAGGDAHQVAHGLFSSVNLELQP